MGDVVPAQAETGNTEVALELANRIEDLYIRANALSKVATAMAEAGAIPAARKIIAQALDAARMIVYGDTVVDILVGVGAVQAGLGKNEAARNTIGMLESDDDPSLIVARVFLGAAEIQVEANRLPAARRSLALSIEAFERVQSFNISSDTFRKRIAMVQAKTGDIVSAFESMSVITCREDHEETFVGLAEFLATMDDKVSQQEMLTSARDVVDDMANSLRRAEAMGQLAELQVSAGDGAGAIETTERISGARFRVQVLNKVAAAHTQVGELVGAREAVNRALKTVEAIANPYYRIEALSEIASTQANMGDIAQAEKTAGLALEKANNIKDNWLRAHALSLISKPQVEVGELVQARKTAAKALTAAKAESHDYYRAWGLYDAAKALNIAGNVEDSQQSMALALEAATGIRAAP
mgnify:FL=1